MILAAILIPVSLLRVVDFVNYYMLEYTLYRANKTQIFHKNI